MERRYAGFFTKQLVGSSVIDQYILQALAGEIEDCFGAVCGEAVLDRTGTGVGLGISVSADALNDRRLSVTDGKEVMTDSGFKMTCGVDTVTRTYTSGDYSMDTHSGNWFEDVPYENDSGVTYYVYAGKTQFPVDVGIARDGSYGYSVWADAAGFTARPDSVESVDGAVVLKVDSYLTDLGMQHWLTSNTEDTDWSMACVVWLDTVQDGVSVQVNDPSIAVANARMTKDPDTDAWLIDLTGIGDGKLGQSVISTEATDYRVAILGPLVTDSADLMDNEGYVFIGTVLSGVSETIDTSGQPITVPYAASVAGFAVEHNVDVGSSDLGRHKKVTAPEDTDLEIMADSASDRLIVIGNKGSGVGVLKVEDRMQVPEIRQNYDLLIDLYDNAADHTLSMRNGGTGALAVLIDADLNVTKAYGGTGNITAHGMYLISSSDVYSPKYSAESLMMAGFFTAAGAGVLMYSNGGGASVPYVWLDVGIGSTKTIMVPIHNPKNYNATGFRVHQSMSSTGTPNIRVAIGRWTEGTTAPLNASGWQACTTKTGAFATNTLTFSPIQLTDAADEKFYLMVEITNNGVANGTAKVHKVAINGTMAYMPTFQQ